MAESTAPLQNKSTKSEMNEGNDVFFFPPLYFPKLCNDIGCWRHLDALTSYMAFFSITDLR